MLDATTRPASTVRRHVLLRWVVLVFLTALATGFVSFSAQHAEASDLSYSAIGTWNGKKIYLSPATHSDSGSRGECRWGENSNGYYVAYHATNGSYYADVPSSSIGRNLRARGYAVRIGRDDNATKITNSNVWAATLHIPIHSNARNGAPNNPSSSWCSSHDAMGTRVMWISSGGHTLSQKLVEWLGQAGGVWGPLESPGTPDFDCDDKTANNCTDLLYLDELDDTYAVAAYVEAEFHDNYEGANWMRYSYYKWSWRFGPAVDQYLGYP